jgi:hypothetical protein
MSLDRWIIGHALYGLHTISPGRLKEQGRVAYAELLETLAEKMVMDRKNG